MRHHEEISCGILTVRVTEFLERTYLPNELVTMNGRIGSERHSVGSSGEL